MLEQAPRDEQILYREASAENLPFSAGSSRFDNARQFTKYLGFSPKGEKSGISVDRRKMDLSGVRDSRRVFPNGPGAGWVEVT